MSVWGFCARQRAAMKRRVSFSLSMLAVDVAKSLIPGIDLESGGRKVLEGK